MSRRVRQTVLRFDSQFRSAGTNDAPIFYLEQRLTNVHMVELRKVMMPNTDYPVNDNTNSIIWRDSLGVSIVSNIANGSYTIAEMLTAIGDIMTTETSDTFTYEASVNPGTFKIIIRHLAGGVNPWNLDGGTLLPLIGQEAGVSDTNGIKFGVNVYDMSGPNYVLIRSPDLVMGSTDFSHFAGPNTGSTNTTNVLEAVYKTGNFGTSVLADYNTKLRQPFHGVLSSCEFSLTYPDGKTVDLNGRPWMVELRVRHSR
jgi:hypothetical protein